MRCTNLKWWCRATRREVVVVRRVATMKKLRLPIVGIEVVVSSADLYRPPASVKFPD